MTELKPCPFCGSTLDIFFETSYKAPLGCYWTETRCFRCGASIHGYGKTKEVSEDHARHRWNTRAERTCEMIRFETGELAVYPDVDETMFHCESCQEEFSLLEFNEDGNVWNEAPKYCPGCGAKVVE